MTESAEYTVELREGRLIEARVFRLLTRDDADAYVREAAYAQRKVFRAAPPALEHLAGGLDGRELARARVFLGEIG